MHISYFPFILKMFSNAIKESNVATLRFGTTKLYPGLVSGYLCIIGDLL